MFSHVAARSTKQTQQEENENENTSKNMWAMVSTDRYQYAFVMHPTNQNEMRIGYVLFLCSRDPGLCPRELLTPWTIAY